MFEVTVRIVLTGTLVALSAPFGSPAQAQVAHCFNDRNGPEVPCTPAGGGGGRGYIAPVPSGPSPAEIARRRRVAAGNAANDRGAAALKRGDYALAVREFANAISLWPEDNNVNGNYWFARAELAFRKGDYGSAVEYYKKAIRYYPKEQHLKISLKVAEELLAVSREDWAKAATTVPKGSRLWHYYRGRRAIAERDWDTAVRELEETNFKPEVFWHAVQATEKLLDTPGVSPNIVPSTKAAIASLKKEAKEAEAHKQSAEKFLRLAREAIDRERHTGNFFGQQANPRNPDLREPLAGPENAGRSGSNVASSQADTVQKGNGSGVPWDGSSHDTIPGNVLPKFEKAAELPFTQEQVTKLASTPKGLEVLEAEKKWRGALEQSNRNISAIKGKLGTAKPEEKQKLMEEWTNELNAQPEINRKLNDLDKEAGQIITQVKLDKN